MKRSSMPTSPNNEPMFELDPDPAVEDKARSIVAEAVGAGSVCWESMESTGVFQDQKALQVVEAAMIALNKHYYMIPKGGNADGVHRVSDR